MTRRNRVDPWGDLHVDPARGLLTGNRGCLVDDTGETVRHHLGTLWISCLTDYRGWRQPLAEPHRWTPLFFLDDAVALAAGHRPCGLCRRERYSAYREAVERSGAVERVVGDAVRLSASDLNAMLTRERLRRGRGLIRSADRIVWNCDIGAVPAGAVIDSGEGVASLVCSDALQPFTFGGWGRPRPRPSRGTVRVLTPPTSVAALRHGFDPDLHPSAVMSEN